MRPRTQPQPKRAKTPTSDSDDDDDDEYFKRQENRRRMLDDQRRFQQLEQERQHEDQAAVPTQGKPDFSYDPEETVDSRVRDVYDFDAALPTHHAASSTTAMAPPERASTRPSATTAQDAGPLIDVSNRRWPVFHHSS
jgi:hypothetical protein